MLGLLAPLRPPPCLSTPLEHWPKRKRRRRGEGHEQAGGASSGSEEEDENEDVKLGEPPLLQPIVLATLEDAEQLLDAAVAHAERPTSSSMPFNHSVHESRAG